MRDRRFVTEHRSGPLNKEQHHQLMQWAMDCAKHVLPYFGEKIDVRLINALKVAKDWQDDKAKVGDARKAAFEALAVANELVNPASVAVARSVMHAVATAHMADHALGSVLYALKAVKETGESVETERKWQLIKLPADIKELVLTALESPKFKRFKI